MNDLPEKPVTPPVKTKPMTPTPPMAANPGTLPTRPTKTELKAITPPPSVLPQSKATTMDFPTAIKHVINGGSIRRVSWPDARDYCYLAKDGWLTILRGDKFHTWNINDGDLEGQDWVALPR